MLQVLLEGEQRKYLFLLLLQKGRSLIFCDIPKLMLATGNYSLLYVGEVTSSRPSLQLM